MLGLVLDAGALPPPRDNVATMYAGFVSILKGGGSEKAQNNVPSQAAQPHLRGLQIRARRSMPWPRQAIEVAPEVRERQAQRAALEQGRGPSPWRYPWRGTTSTHCSGE